MFSIIRFKYLISQQYSLTFGWKSLHLGRKAYIWVAKLTFGWSNPSPFSLIRFMIPSSLALEMSSPSKWPEMKKKMGLNFLQKSSRTGLTHFFKTSYNNAVLLKLLSSILTISIPDTQITVFIWILDNYCLVLNGNKDPFRWAM